ncbi:hypothetical protein Acr_13g0005750 [Actinidia rufa]|uniref:Uncharacterized protein n=1 Tax=Actinidia rufa TaxID=165716 RepID=A0A7J0FKE6_9ERIC|nr:hypothetical protein Acr_13g0005750 [Actinidia rufa]
MSTTIKHPEMLPLYYDDLNEEVDEAVVELARVLLQAKDTSTGSSNGSRSLRLSSNELAAHMLQQREKKLSRLLQQLSPF